MNRPLARNLRPIFLGMTSMVVLAACTTASTVDEASAPATETAAPVRAGVVPQQASDSYYVTASGAVACPLASIMAS